MTILNQVDEFMTSSLPSRWLGDEHIAVYVRKGHHLINGEMINTFDVANIVQDPEHCSKGYFKAFMQKVESLDLPIYVECILNPKLVEILKRNEYSIIEHYGSIHAFKPKG